MKNLEKQLKAQVLSDAKKHPEKFLKSHEGEVYNSKCPKCGNELNCSGR